MDGLNTVLEYLTSVPAWYLATSVGGQPHVRPFSFAQIQDGKLWFVTARTKDVWQELLQNQRFEVTSWIASRRSSCAAAQRHRQNGSGNHWRLRSPYQRTL